MIDYITNHIRCFKKVDEYKTGDFDDLKCVEVYQHGNVRIEKIYFTHYGVKTGDVDYRIFIDDKEIVYSYELFDWLLMNI